MINLSIEEGRRYTEEHAWPAKCIRQCTLLHGSIAQHAVISKFGTSNCLIGSTVESMLPNFYTRFVFLSPDLQYTALSK
jgi:hypothetical protein